MEGMTFDTVKKEKLLNGKGLNYLDFRQTLTPKYAIICLHILTGYMALAVVMGGAFLLQKTVPGLCWVSIPIGGMLVGYTISALHLFMHEAAHYHLASDKKMNDCVADIFIGLLIGMETNFYRSVHFAHHRLIGTKRDTEKSYFEGITVRFLFESLAGIRLIKVIIHRNKNIKLNYGEMPGEVIIKKNNFIFMTAALLNVLLLAALFAYGYWQPALTWIFGIGIMFPFFAMFRQILEHRTFEAKSSINYDTVDPGASHRMFGDGPIASTLGAAGFNRHLIHHWDPHVSYTRLKDVETYLMDTQSRHELQQSQTTYFKTFIALFNR